MSKSGKDRERKGHPNREMTSAHKAALAKGREEGRIVRSYLESLEASRPRRGRRRTRASVERQLRSVDEKIETADQLARLHLIQQKKNLVAELESWPSGDDGVELEERFVTVARSYAERKGISYATWREMGVSTSVLQRAGIARSRG